MTKFPQPSEDEYANMKGSVNNATPYAARAYLRVVGRLQLAKLNNKQKADNLMAWISKTSTFSWMDQLKSLKRIQLDRHFHHKFAQ